MGKNKLKRSLSLVLIFTLLWEVLLFGGEYHIKAGDVLEIVVVGRDDLSRTVLVAPDGTISVPLIDDIQVAGLTIREVDDKVTAKLSRFVEGPQVTVILKEISQERGSIYVMGHVKRPGSYEINGSTNLIEAIYRAGGPEKNARLSDSFIIRGSEKIPVDISAALKQKDLSGYTPLLVGDVLFIPEEEMVLKKRIRVFIRGEVRNPGFYEFEDGISLFDAITRTGGFTEDADLDNIRVVRKGQDPIVVSMNQALREGDIVSQNILLAPRDVVFVPPTIIGATKNVMKTMSPFFGFIVAVSSAIQATFIIIKYIEEGRL